MDDEIDGKTHIIPSSSACDTVVYSKEQWRSCWFLLPSFLSPIVTGATPFAKQQQRQQQLRRHPHPDRHRHHNQHSEPVFGLWLFRSNSHGHNVDEINIIKSDSQYGNDTEIQDDLRRILVLGFWWCVIIIIINI
jgi:hypothetical protein